MAARMPEVMNRTTKLLAMDIQWIQAGMALSMVK
eukprot:CAMPEP_0172572340 /NCGR_PEP_ID=MMETSP1067-20121228/134748_1 /TAXON_ID=265564 ORGANISM="Thalassiosira punctigera, Strain Tpunct2005C2" /NCGR_SAMPLE_ID=MMETSP1067 /ASSEMBLY_ACC=CAM_ASM_000444 /LENGTH=33 /DNA_ID= /DNA_START= /DNA_END= /DNA_ORIENTATION=